MEVLQTPTFIRQSKKLHKNQKKDLDNAIRAIIQDPLVGEMKKGDLSGVQVYKFRMVNQLTLLAYEVFEDKLELVLLALGTHENFYRDFKK
jgi:mRNA-degrading endonuclease YafQ of YafQ-DinJ toxin-antitoxin module